MRPPSDKVPALLDILDYRNRKSPCGWSSVVTLRKCPASTTLDGLGSSDPWGSVFPVCTHSRQCACPDSLSVCVLSRSVVSDSFQPQWTIARQAPLSMGFPRQEYWSGLPFPPAGDLPDPGMEPTSASPASAGRFSTTEAPGKPDPLSGQEDSPAPGLLALRSSSCLCLSVFTGFALYPSS